MRRSRTPAGIGSPMLDSVESRLASILFGVPAVKGVEFGAGFCLCGLRGSHANDPFYEENGVVERTETNNNGGILGGITSGMPLIVRACIASTPSIGMVQDTLNIRTGKVEPLSIHGRHDPCIVTRAAPVVEAARAVALADLLRGGEGLSCVNFLKSGRTSTVWTPPSESCSCCVCRWRSRSQRFKARSDDKIYKPDREAEIVENAPPVWRRSCSSSTFPFCRA